MNFLNKSFSFLSISTIPLPSHIYTLVSGFVGGLVLAFLPISPTIALEDRFQSTHQLNLFQAIILGMVQGLTEFLPISSTAHLKAVPVALGWGDPGVAFTAVIQLGSIAAVLWYFWKDLTNLTAGFIQSWGKKDYQSQDFRIVLGIIVGTMPIIIFGLSLKFLVSDLDNSPLRSMTTIAIASIVMAILLAIAEITGNHQRNFEQLRSKDGILMGLAQSLALIPGVSRSGSTITSGLFMNLERDTAARFSFLLGIPAITLAGLVELKDVFKQGLELDSILVVIVGVVSSAVFSYVAIAWLINYLKKRNTWVFVWYRLAFGVIILGPLVIK
jgi:undecaprenyl-diphosphatase